jgi:hypothetical protein
MCVLSFASDMCAWQSKQEGAEIPSCSSEAHLWHTALPEWTAWCDCLTRVESSTVLRWEVATKTDFSDEHANGVLIFLNMTSLI